MADAPFAPLPLCLIFSDDDALCRRLGGLLRERAYVVTTPSLARLRSLLHDGAAGPGTGDPVLLFFDLRLPEAPDLLPELIGAARGRISTVALGRDGSTPFAAAEDGRLYRVVDFGSVADLRALGEVVDRALERVGLQQENGLLRAELARLRGGAADPLASRGGGGSGAEPAGGVYAAPLAAQQLVRPARHEAGPAEVFESIVDGAASALAVSRVGIFHSPREGQPFRLRAGRHCLELGWEFAGDDPVARWLERHRQPVSRRSAEALGDPAGRVLLRRALDLLGAESLVPLFVRGRLAGWLFTGAPFEGTAGRGVDFHSLTTLSEHAVTALENSVLYEETALQKTLVESVLQTLPFAVVAVEPDGLVRWSNARAEALFPVLAERRRDRPGPIIEDVSSRLAGLVHSALAGDPAAGEPLVWELAVTARTYSARAYAPRGADSGGRTLGVFAIIEDISEELSTRTQREVTARQALCADISSSLAHEIRNPLVALKTFAQLLPQRHADPEFRQEFSSLTEREVDRLDALLEKLDAFAVAPRLAVQAPLNILEVLRAAEEATKKQFAAADPRFKLNPTAKGLAAQAALASLPAVYGDAAALTRCFTALFSNGVEAAVRKGVIPVVTVDVVRYGEAPAALNDQPAIGRNAQAGSGFVGPDAGIRVAVADNGAGIAPELLPRVFSPFCTTKTQGLGLGLPEAQQIILEHGGRLELDSGTRGVCAHIVLPLRSRGPGGGGR